MLYYYEVKREGTPLRIKKLALTVLAAGLTLLLTGCFVKTVDELYTLPKHSDEYHRLEQAIEQVMASQNAVYAAPVSGTNQQSVQLADLDGDGAEEAIAFLKTTGEKPLRACIFAAVDGEYRLMDTIEGVGTSFSSVEYGALRGEKGVELIIGRQLSTDVLQSLSAYAYTDGHVVELMSANYTEYRVVDLDSDGKPDIFVLRFDAEQPQAVAELYRWRNGQIERAPEAYLSAGATQLKRILAGKLTQTTPAIFVASAYEQTSLITDVFAMQDGVFRNISAADGDGAVSTVRNYYVYAADVDEDGLIELPRICQLRAQPDAEESFSTIDWYNLDLSGSTSLKLTTYHNFSGGWFLILPQLWGRELCITRSAEVGGVRGYTISSWLNAQRTESIVTIYAFSGENRTQMAEADGRFLLAEKGDVSYSALLGTGQTAQGLTQDRVKELFRFIHIDWNSGET